MLVTSALVGLLALASADPSSSAPEPTRDDASDAADRYLPGLFFSGSVSLGFIHRHSAPLTDPDSITFPGVVPAAKAGVRVSGAPSAAPALEISVEGRVHTAFRSHVRVRGDAAELQRTPARPMGGSAAAGVTFWPRAVGHRLGVGGELGYRLAPFVIARGRGLPSYTLHGAILRGRIEGQALDDRLLVIGRPFVGVAAPYRLEAAAMTRPAPQVGVVIEVAWRVQGPFHIVADIEAWNARMPRGSRAPFDDHEVAVSLGLLVRTRGR